MGIKLDWEVESEGGWNEVGEDPKAVEARQRQARRMRNILLIILAILLVLGGIVAYRLFMVGQQVREALRTTVAAETLALRMGDRDAYLEVQSRLGGWHQIQELAFQDYQAEGASVEITGQIVEMDISANQARVTLREGIGGKLYHVIWFYQRDGNGWKHIAPSPRFWGDKKELHTTYFDFDYYSEDQTLVDALKGPLDDWWQAACDLTECTDKPTSLDVKIEPDPLAEIGWALYDANTLIVPSPQLGRFPADGKTDPALISQLADLVAYRWAEHLVGEAVQPYSEADWLRSEIHYWLRHSFDPTQPPAPLLTPLVQNYGKQIIPPLIEHIKRGDPLVPVLQELTETSAADLPVGWELYFTNKLRAEDSLLRQGKETEAILLYRDPKMPPGFDVASSIRVSGADTIQVVGLRRYGNLVWAETEFTGFTEIPSNTMTTFLPFRLLSDRWVRTSATETDWGPAREERGTHVILRYYDIDTLTVGGLQASLEQTYNQLIVSVGDPAAVVGSPVLMLVEVVGYDTYGNPLPLQGAGLGEEQRTTPGVFFIDVASPYSTYFSKGTAQERLRLEATHGLITALTMQTLDLEHPLGQAFQQWAISRFGGSSTKFGSLTSVEHTMSCNVPTSIEIVWLENEFYEECRFVVAKVLIAVLAEKYGDEGVARLISNLNQVYSVDDWLYLSLGIRSADIEEEWIERVRLELSSMP